MSCRSRPFRAEYPILNLEQGHSGTRRGRLIFYVADVDGFWTYLQGTRIWSATAAGRFLG